MENNGSTSLQITNNVPRYESESRGILEKLLQHRVRGVGEGRRDMVLNDGVDEVVMMVVIGSSIRTAVSNNMINQKSQNTVTYSFRCRCWWDHSFRSTTVERGDKGRGNK